LTTFNSCDDLSGVTDPLLLSTPKSILAFGLGQSPPRRAHRGSYEAKPPRDVVRHVARRDGRAFSTSKTYPLGKFSLLTRTLHAANTV